MRTSQKLLLTALAIVFVLPIYKAMSVEPLEQSGLYLGPQISVYNTPDADNVSFMGGVALRMKLSQYIGFEGSINYRQEEYSGGSVTARSWPVMITGLVFPIPIVYGAFGFGWYNTNLSYNNTKLNLSLTSETQQKIGWHFGGGVEIPVGTSIKLVGDVRYVFLNYDFKEYPGSDHLKANFYVLTVGFMFKL